MQKYYTVYKIDKATDDISNVAEFTDRKEVSEYLKIRLDNLSKYVAKNIDNITCKLKNDSYFIMIEKDTI